MPDQCAEQNIVSDIEIIEIKDIHPADDHVEKGDM
jgi:alcohol dehydrogenase (NADP+)